MNFKKVTQWENEAVPTYINMDMVRLIIDKSDIRSLIYGSENDGFLHVKESLDYLLNKSETKAEKKMDRAVTTEDGEAGTQLLLPIDCASRHECTEPNYVCYICERKLKND